MQTQGLTSQSKTRETPAAGADDGPETAAHPMSIGRLGLIAFVVGCAVGAWSAWGLDQVASAATAAVAAGPAVAAEPAVVAEAVAAPAATGGPAAGRSLFVAIPRDGDYLTSTTIPVAGTALGRPHGPRIETIHVELITGGQVIDAADIDVFSGRFAGALTVAGSSGRLDAELRFSYPGREKGAVLVKDLTIDPR